MISLFAMLQGDITPLLFPLLFYVIIIFVAGAILRWALRVNDTITRLDEIVTELKRLK